MIKLSKAILTLLMLLFLSSIFFRMEDRFSVKSSTSILYVPLEYPTIQAAINNASDGDTIFVYVGVYYENVVVNKTVSLVGEDRNSTIIDGNGTGKVITITATNVSVQGFTIRNSGLLPSDSGIYVDHSVGNNISCNTILATNDGLSLYFSHNNLISGNTMSSNSYGGVVLYSSDDNTISDNVMISNYYGIQLYSSSDNTFSSNAILLNYIIGIYLYSSSGNTFSSNTISSNYFLGMQTDSYSINNTVYHNNFINTKNVQNTAVNFWSYEEEGNYWNDYKGRDLNADGIGDSPYIIDSYNQDDYPMMGTFSSFNITFQDETHYVTLISNSTILDFKFEIGTETGNRIIRFNATGEGDTVGFCRVRVPTQLMKYPYIVLVGNEEAVPIFLDPPNATYLRLYLTYPNKDHAITIISSETLRLYYELLADYTELQEAFYNLNATYYDLNRTYYDLLNNYTVLSSLYDALQEGFDALNASYQLLPTLNNTYYDLLRNYNILLNNYSQLQRDFDVLNDSYLDHLLEYSKQVQNMRSLVYIFAATTAAFMVITVYLSKRAHKSAAETKVIEER